MENFRKLEWLIAILIECCNPVKDEERRKILLAYTIMLLEKNPKRHSTVEFEINSKLLVYVTVTSNQLILVTGNKQLVNVTGNK